MENMTSIQQETALFDTKKVKKIKRKLSPVIIILLVVLLVYAVSLFVPILWGLMTSLKDKYELRNNAFGLPEKWLFSNYIDAFDHYRVKVEAGAGFKWVFFEEMTLYSLLYAVGCAAIQATVTCLVAYVTAKFKHFAFSKFIYSLVIVVMILPIIGSTPSELALARSLGIYNQIWGMWIMKFNFLGMYYLVFHAMFRGIPKDFADAAYIDGASEWQVLFRIMLPMARNTLLTVILLNFIGYWNDYQTPLLYIPSYPTMAYGLYLFSNDTTNALSTIPMKITGCMIMMLPIMVLFLCFHKRLIGNLSMGGLKE